MREATTHGDRDGATGLAEPGGPALLLAFARGRFAGDLRLALGERSEVPLGRGVDAFGAGALDDARMSRRHAMLRRVGGAWTVSDLGSRNGTFVNGRRVQTGALLSANDVLRLGDSLFVFTRRPPAGAPETPGADGIAGASAAIAQVRRDVRQVAELSLAVLVTGETGTGKEVVARALHACSGRSGRLMAVNCAALPESLMESELFGHARGAFSGATHAHAGLFREADQGTLLLDEVSEMPPAAQAKLLRVLETGETRAVGAAHAEAVDVRVVAATNRDLPAEVRAGRFRMDLYARLAQWAIHIAPLRERREDVAALAAHFLAAQGAAERAIHVELAEALLLHAWPLNARGLKHIAGIALVESASGPLLLSPRVRAALERERAVTAAAPAARPAPPPPSETPTLPEPPSREALEALLRRRRGKVIEVARELRVSRQQVYRWMAALQLDPKEFR